MMLLCRLQSYRVHRYRQPYVSSMGRHLPRLQARCYNLQCFLSHQESPHGTQHEGYCLLRTSSDIQLQQTLPVLSAPDALQHILCWGGSTRAQYHMGLAIVNQCPLLPTVHHFVSFFANRHSCN